MNKIKRHAFERCVTFSYTFVISLNMKNQETFLWINQGNCGTNWISLNILYFALLSRRQWLKTYTLPKFKWKESEPNTIKQAMSKTFTKASLFFNSFSYKLLWKAGADPEFGVRGAPVVRRGSGGRLEAPSGSKANPLWGPGGDPPPERKLPDSRDLIGLKWSLQSQTFVMFLLVIIIKKR